jgi:hypothetical protein
MSGSEGGSGRRIELKGRHRALVRPYDAAAVFAVDEKPQIQALDRTASTLPMLPGTPGTPSGPPTITSATELSICSPPSTSLGERSSPTSAPATPPTTSPSSSTRSTAKSPPASQCTSDNLSAHKTPKVQRWLLRHRRFHPQFTPTYSSWLNLVWVNRTIVLCAHYQEIASLRASKHQKNSRPTSPNGSSTGTTTPRHSFGTRPPTILDSIARYCHQIAAPNTSYE